MTELRPAKRVKFSLPHDEPNLDSPCLVQFLAPCTIPTWQEDDMFTMHRKYCNIPSNMQCRNCVKLCFNKKIRGLPTRKISWFLDASIDAAVKFTEDKNCASIFKEVTSYLRKSEVQLRLVTKRKVLEDLISRFRGLTSKSCIDSLQIIKMNQFSSLERWCKWKDAFDRLVIEKQAEKASNRLFCTGCGNRSERFVARYGDTYERCSTENCYFFCKPGADFARVKKR